MELEEELEHLFVVDHGRVELDVHRLSVVPDSPKGSCVKADGLTNERPVSVGPS